jgi:hypothetical protein
VALRARRFILPLVVLLVAGVAGVALATGVLAISNTHPDSAVAITHTPVTGDLVERPSAQELATCTIRRAPAKGPKPTTGTLYYDKNQNGHQDRGEPGLAGIAVYLSRTADSESPGEEKSPATCTDSHGHYQLVPPDASNGYRVEVRTGWARSQCPGLTCGPGGADNNLQAGPEWIFSGAVTGKAAHVYNAGLIPDAGQYIPDIHTQTYSAYPPMTGNAHALDLAVRFTDDESAGCETTSNGVSCQIGETLDQTVYIANTGTRSATGVRAVMQLPYGETHRALTLLKSGSSPGITGISAVTVTPPTGPRPKGKSSTSANYTTVTFTVDGSIPPAGLVAVESVGTLTSGTPGTQIVGRAGIIAEDGQADDTDSAFCPDPAILRSCPHISDTHSFFDLSGDDNDSDRFNVIGRQP